MGNPVTLTFHVSQQLMNELTLNGSGNGVYAYLWNNQPVDAGTSSFVSTSSTAAAPATNYFTDLVLDGARQGGTLNATTNTWDFVVELTDDSVAHQISGGKVYLIVQSDPLAPGTTHVDLTAAAGIGNTEGAINATNAAAWHFGYDTFEVALKNNSADVADLSSINSFGHELGLSVVYADGTVGARGYSPDYPASGFDALIAETSQAVGSVDANYPYSTGSTAALWNGGKSAGMITITPATTQDLPAGSTLPNAWTPADWTDYVTAVGKSGGIRLVGYFNGAEDAAHIYHNAGYFAYSVALKSLAAGNYGAAGNYFVLTPDASSQIKGAIVISPESLANNLWSPGLSGANTAAYIYTDATLSTPFNIDGTTPTGEMNTGANNQWGTVFTQFFTGFSGGYYGGVGKGIPAVEGSTVLGTQTVNLDHNWNWDPTYAFDGGRSDTPPDYQHYDPYAKLYFDNSNVYGGAYSDALTAAFTTSVLLPVWTNPGSPSGQDVSNIDLWGFGVAEKMTNVPGTSTPFYAPNSIDNYIAPASGKTDYDLGAAPPPPAAGASPVFGPNNVTINLANNGMLADPAKADIKLGIYLGNGQFQYVPLPSGAAQNGGGFWQQWMITQDTTKPAGQQFAIASIPIPANPQANPPNPGSAFTPGSFGSLSFASFPSAANATLVYELVVGDKTFTFYATTNAGQQFTDVASDGLGVVTLPSDAASATFTLSVIPGTMNALESGVMIPDTDASYINALPPNTVTAPVAGTLTGGVFQALQTTAGQATDFNSTLTLDAVTPLYFGWTGLSDAGGVPSWIAAATNKIHAGNIAEIDVQAAGLLGHAVVRAPAADVDGQWQTTRALQLGASGTYTVTMTERLPDGTLYGAPSSPLTITVTLSTLKKAGSVIEGYSTAKLASLAGQGVDILDAAGNHLTLNVAQALALGPVVLARSDLVTVLDTGAAIAALSPDALRGLDWRHVDILDASDDRLVLTLAQVQALGHIHLSAGDEVVVTVSPGAMPTRAGLAALAADGVDTIASTGGELALIARQALALGDIHFAADDLVTLVDISAHIEALAPAALASFAEAGIDRIIASDSALTLSLAQFDALGSMQVMPVNRLSVLGTAGDDVIRFTTQVLGAEDRVDGGDGADTLLLDGAGYGALVLQSRTVTHVETLAFGAGHDYGVTTHARTIAAGATLTVDASALAAADHLVFDGAAERGHLRFLGGAGSATVTGGTGADTIEAGSGAEVLRYTAAQQSTGAQYDRVSGFDAAIDHFSIAGGVAAVDAPVLGATLSKAHLDADLAVLLGGLGPHHAVLVEATAGTLAGAQFLATDMDGAVGYSAGTDLLIRLDAAQHLDTLGLGVFL